MRSQALLQLELHLLDGLPQSVDVIRANGQPIDEGWALLPWFTTRRSWLENTCVQLTAKLGFEGPNCVVVFLCMLFMLDL